MTKKRSNSQTDQELSNSQEAKVDPTLRLVETTDRALELINSLASESERFEGDPGDLFDQMDEMRQNLQTAWKDVLLEDEASCGEVNQVHLNQSISQGTKRGNDGSNFQTTKEDQDKFRKSYVETMTEVLADPLDAMRQQYEQEKGSAGPDMDIDLLVDALQSGIDLLNPEEKMLFWEELNAIEQTEKEEAKGESIHTLQQHELGYL